MVLRSPKNTSWPTIQIWVCLVTLVLLLLVTGCRDFFSSHCHIFAFWPLLCFCFLSIPVFLLLVTATVIFCYVFLYFPLTFLFELLIPGVLSLSIHVFLFYDLYIVYIFLLLLCFCVLVIRVFDYWLLHIFFLVTVLFLLSGTVIFCFLDTDVFLLSIYVLTVFCYLPLVTSVILLYDRYHVFVFWSRSCFSFKRVLIIYFLWGGLCPAPSLFNLFSLFKLFTFYPKTQLFTRCL
jgi:hypothetical protein